MTLLGIYGASGCGRGVMPFVRAAAKAKDRLVFVDDGATQKQCNGHDVLDFEAFRAAPETGKAICIAIANSAIREALALRCTEAGIGFFSARAANTVVMDEVEVGEGAILSPFVVLTSNIRIGRHFHANLSSYVEHDCIIGDFVTFAPGAKCNGNVVIGDHAYIGAGAVIRQGRPGVPLTIGKGAVIGMGAVVTRDVPAGVTVVGNPARPLLKD